MTMRRLLIFILGALTAIPLIAYGQEGIQQLNQWKTGGQTYLQPINAAYGLKVPGLATSTTGCLSVNGSGWISPNGSACGGGGGSGSPGGASSTVQVNSNGSFYGNNNFTFNGTNVGIGTASPASLLDILGDYPTFKVTNYDGAQYSGAGFYLQNSSVNTGQSGYTFYSGINDAGDTQGFLALDETNKAGVGTGHVLLATGTSTFEVYPALLVNGSNAQLTQDAGGYLNYQEVGGLGNGEQSILQILAPLTQPQESTLTLSRVASAGNREFTDFSDENYSTGANLNGGVDHTSSLNISKQGTGTFRPFDLRFWNQDLGTIAATSFTALTVVPNTNNTGTLPTSVNVGIGTSTPYSPLSVWGANTTKGVRAFEVTNSASTTLFSVDNAGNVNVSTSLAVGTTTPTNGIGLAIATSTYRESTSFTPFASSTISGSGTVDWFTDGTNGTGGNVERLLLNQTTTVTLNSTSSFNGNPHAMFDGLKVCQDAVGGRQFIITGGDTYFSGISTSSNAAGVQVNIGTDPNTCNDLYGEFSMTYPTQKYILDASSTEYPSQ